MDVSEQCAWCGEPIDPGDSYLLQSGQGAAAFCRLEHVVPFVMRDRRLIPAGAPRPRPRAAPCTHCGAPTSADPVALAHNRSGEILSHDFCSLDHARAWALKGGDFAPG